MKIILTETDIKELITKSYKGVKEIIVPDKMEITLTVDNKQFLQHDSITATHATTPPTPLETIEDREQRERKTGVMASGGVARTMTTF